MRHLPWHEAVAQMHRAGEESARVHRLPLAQTSGSVLAQDLTTPIPLPHYDSSAMDGYAVAGASPWRVIEPAAQGLHANRHRETVELREGTATPIFTGGLIPAGTTAILRLEHAQLQAENETSLLHPLHGEPEPGKDIRRAGEELQAGSIVARAGEKVSARLLSFLAVCGFDALPVYARPTVSIAYTGNEVITSGIPSAGEVRDAYSVQFPEILADIGLNLESATRLHDDPQELRDWFSDPSTAQSEVLILTGGSSTSEVDLLRQELARQGATYRFEAVAVRPGHPCLCAELPDGRLVLGLPGNPLAAYTSLYSYLPAFCAGRSGKELPARARLSLAEAVGGFKKSDLRIIPARVEGNLAYPLLRRAQSHMLSDFARADALLVVPPQGLEPGDCAEALFF